MSKNNKQFEEVDTRIDFPEMEKDILEDWYSNGIVDKYLELNNDSKERFSFIDGPITANNPMGVHHAWGRTYKDLWQRYKNMQGFKQRFQNGFDAQGLWVEVEVEKELEFKNKKEIEDYGVDKFVEKCKQRVRHYSDIQTEQSKRLGYFMDWENSYYTMSDKNNYMIWHFLDVCDQHGWIYKGKDSVPWCPRCETAISQHEMLTEDYKEVTHESIYMAFPIVEHEDEYLLVWTTTPWTIPANIAVAVDEELEYSLVKHENGNKYWVASDAAERIFEQGSYKIESEVKGEKLTGLRYEGVFDDLPAVKSIAKEYRDKFHVVIATDKRIMPINTSEGTGLVHTAVSAGSEDFKLGKKLGLPMIPVIDDTAAYLDELGFLTGQNAKKDPRLILDHMEKQDSNKDQHWVYKIEDYKHRYPACWRCKTELVWKVTDEWYIAMDKKSQKEKEDDRTLRERMIEVAGKIEWIPSFGLDRELDWLNNMHDWLISKKNRYWGLCLPIWECEKCGDFQVIGSKQELKENAVKGWEDFEGKSPHKPQIDQVKIKCSKCDEMSSRIEPVGNPWLDAGIVPFSTISKDNKGEPLYLTDKAQWEKWFPADFITESFPGQFKNWFYSMIAMSTVLEDDNPYNTVLGFGTLLAEDGRPMHKSWGNAIEFNEGADEIGVDVMRWMYSRQKPSDNMLFGYKIADETRRKFHLKLWNVYNYFVTYANIDNWKPSDELSKPLSSDNILDKWILMRLTQTLDTTTKSLDGYDARTSALAIEEFVEDLSNWYIRRSRGRTGSGSEDKVDSDNFYKSTYFILVNLVKMLAPFMPFMTESIYTNLTGKESVHLESWPEMKIEIDRKILTNMKTIREIAEMGHAQRKENKIPVRQPLQKLTTNYQDPGEGFTDLLKEEINVKQIEWDAKGKDEPFVELDTEITPELEQEAKTRSLIRKIQRKRKKMGVEMDAEIEVTSDWLPEDKKLRDQIKEVTLAKKLKKGEFGVKVTS